MRTLSFLVQVAWRNLWRQRRRTLITASAIALSVAMCMATLAINDGSYAKLFNVMVEQQLGHVRVHHEDYPGKRVMFDTLADASSLLERLDGLEGTVAAAPRLNGYALVGSGDLSAGGQLIGIVPPRETDVTNLQDRVIDGRYLDESPKAEALIGTGLAEELEIGPGGEIVVVTQSADGSMGNMIYNVAGVFRTGNTAMDRSGVYLHLADLQELLVLEDQAHEMILLTTDDDAVETYAETVSSMLPEGPAEAQPWWIASPPTAEMMKMRDVTAIITLGIVFLVAGFGLLNTMLMAVYERTRELGVLRALGLRPRMLVYMVNTEAVLLSLVGCAAGLVLGAALDGYLVVYGLDFSEAVPDGFSFAGVTIDPVLYGQVRPEPIALILTCAVAVALIGSFIPAIRAAMLRPVEAIRHEE